jgi:RTA1 like protein
MTYIMSSYLIPLTIGPAWIAGSIYLCLARIVVAYGKGISRFSPRTYTIVFMSCDFTSLCLQGAGGGIASTANTHSESNTGRYIMIAGLAFQVLSLAVFMILWLDFIRRLRMAPLEMKDRRFASLREDSLRFKGFQYGMYKYLFSASSDLLLNVFSSLVRYYPYFHPIDLSRCRAAKRISGNCRK